jgi:putative acetyltransferase
MQIRAYEPADAARLALLFFASVRIGGLRDYSPAQVAAWAPAVPDPARVDARARDGRCVMVAVNAASESVAYGELEANGHIDHLYCHPDVIGTGVASALYDCLERTAREQGLTRLFTEASEAARRLFLRKGFTEIARQDFLRHGVPIHNYRMEKRLGAG